MARILLFRANMKYLLPSLALASLAVVIAGCGQPTLDETVKEFIANNGGSYKDCGSFEIAPNSTCGIEPSAAVACFVDGYASCQPVRLDFTQITVEGDPIYVTYLVVSQGKICEVETFVDTREDAFGPKGIVRQTCSTVVGNGTCDAALSVEDCISPCASGSDCG